MRGKHKEEKTVGRGRFRLFYEKDLLRSEGKVEVENENEEGRWNEVVSSA